MIAQKITYIRKIKKITEKELSNGIGMSMTGFRQAMSNNDFKVSTLQKIADYLKVDIKYFIDDTINEISFNNNNVLEEPGITYRRSEPLSQNDLLIKQKDDIIADLKYTIESLKKNLESKDKMIDILENLNLNRK
jgi:transcriptional regulator with XRE-family HTH domain